MKPQINQDVVESISNILDALYNDETFSHDDAVAMIVNLIETAKAEARREFAEEVQECLQIKLTDHLFTLENRYSMQLLRVSNKVREVLATLNSKEG